MWVKALLSLYIIVCEGINPAPIDSDAPVSSGSHPFYL